MTSQVQSALVLQGGGALGAYELGAARALYKEKHFSPDLIAGVSIGAITAVILARPARGLKPLEALEAFWEKVSVPGLLFPPALRRYASFFGNANFFVPRANEATLAAKRTTSKIPIVMLSVFDPIGEGIVESLAHPGGNVTGVIMDDSAEISAKRLQLLKDAIPQISQVAVLMNPDEAYAHTEWRALEPAAQTLRTALQAIPVRRISEFEGAFQRITNQRLDAVFILNGNPNFVHRWNWQRRAGWRPFPVLERLQKPAVSCLTDQSGLIGSDSWPSMSVRF